MWGTPFLAGCWFLSLLIHCTRASESPAGRAFQGLEDSAHGTNVFGVVAPDGSIEGLNFNLQAPSTEDDKELALLAKEQEEWKSPPHRHSRSQSQSHSHKKTMSVDGLGRLTEVEETEDIAGMLRAERKCANDGDTCVCNGVVGRGVHGDVLEGNYLRVDGQIPCTNKSLGGSPTEAQECHCYSLGWCEGRTGVIDSAHRRRTFKGKQGVQMYQRRRWCGFGPRDCTWGQWGTWSKTCEGKCGTGQLVRRRLEEEAAVNGGKCEAPPKESKPCKLKPCPMITRMRNALKKLVRWSRRRSGLRRRRRRWLRWRKKGGSWLRRRRRRNAFTKAWSRVWARRRGTASARRRRWLRRLASIGSRLKKLKSLATKVFKQPAVQNPTLKGSTTASVESKAVPGWQSVGTKFVHSGNGAFGGIRSRYGNHFVQLPVKGTSLEQNIQGHKPGRKYQLDLDIASCPGQLAPILAVKIAGKLVKAIVPNGTSFQRYIVDYVADAANVSIELDNDSPTNNASVLVDRITDKVKWGLKRSQMASRIRSVWGRLKNGLAGRRRRRGKGWRAKLRSWKGRVKSWKSRIGKKWKGAVSKARSKWGKLRSKFNISKLGKRFRSAWSKIRNKTKGFAHKARRWRNRLRSRFGNVTRGARAAWGKLKGALNSTAEKARKWKNWRARLSSRFRSAQRKRKGKGKGTETQAQACYESGYYYPWMKSESMSKEANLENCQKRCATVAACKHFSFWAKTGKCYLTDTKAKFRRRRKGVSAGPPTGCVKATSKGEAGNRTKGKLGTRGTGRPASKKKRGLFRRKKGAQKKGVARTKVAGKAASTSKSPAKKKGGWRRRRTRSPANKAKKQGGRRRRRGRQASPAKAKGKAAKGKAATKSKTKVAGKAASTSKSPAKKQGGWRRRRTRKGAKNPPAKASGKPTKSSTQMSRALAGFRTKGKGRTKTPPRPQPKRKATGGRRRRRTRRRKGRRFFMEESTDPSLLLDSTSNDTQTNLGSSMGMRSISNLNIGFIGLPRLGSVLTRKVPNLITGRMYHLRFRVGCPSNARAPNLRVLVDNTELKRHRPKPGEFHEVMVRFKATAPEMKVVFENLGPGERGAYLDDISLESVWPELKNHNFQKDAKTDTFKYMAPPRWKSKHTVIIHSDNGAWGRTTSFIGEHFVGIQGHGSFVEQIVAGVPGRTYRVKFYAARRKGNPAARLRVRAGGKLLKTIEPRTNAFAKHTVEFIAKAKTTAIRFENASPAGDYTVFLDHITMTEVGPEFPP